jgi:hypothetical protein
MQEHVGGLLPHTRQVGGHRLLAVTHRFLVLLQHVPVDLLLNVINSFDCLKFEKVRILALFGQEVGDRLFYHFILEVFWGYRMHYKLLVIFFYGHAIIVGFSLGEAWVKG